MATTIKYASLGSVSSGTMRTEDLLYALSREVEFQLGRQSSRFPRRAFRKLVKEAQNVEDYDSEDAGYIVEALFEALEQFAPPYAYFGAHPGDGSGYGYWLSEGFDEDFDELKVSDLADVPAGYRGEVLIVNDHGNCTLGWIDSRGKFHETWSVV